MSFTQTHLSYKFKLQQKPEGGWIATSDEPACTLEGTTREEVEQKIRAKLMEQLQPEIAEKIKLSLPGVNVNTKFNIKIRRGSPDTDMPHSLLPGSGNSGPKLEAAISPKLLVLIGAAATVLILLWRIAHH